jgi:biopolymer transport protein ExbB
MIESLEHGLVRSGASWVLWLLLGLSVVSIAIMIERARLFWSQRDDVSALCRDLDRLLAAGDVGGGRLRLEKSKSIEARVALAGLSQWDEGERAAREAMAAATGLARVRFERRLLFLGTLGNNAPFVGLLGTVIGVVSAFDALGSGQSAAAGQLAPERVMSAIAEALVATAVGLVVAIPAVAVFNYFQGQLATAIANAETIGHVVLTHLGRRTTVATEDLALAPTLVVPRRDGSAAFMLAGSE